MSRFSLFFLSLCCSESNLLGLGIHQQPVIGWRCGGMMVLGSWRGCRDWLMQAHTRSSAWWRHTHTRAHRVTHVRMQKHTHGKMHKMYTFGFTCMHIKTHTIKHIVTHMYAHTENCTSALNLELHACTHTSTQCAWQSRLNGGDWNQKGRERSEGG